VYCEWFVTGDSAGEVTTTGSAAAHAAQVLRVLDMSLAFPADTTSTLTLLDRSGVLEVSSKHGVFASPVLSSYLLIMEAEI
jgi:hypothetical protein